jgi:mRNA-degrading endonuclease toxin of MazEF toxin-antitoxin module
MGKVKKERYDNRYLTISQGDVLLINFGRGSTVCRTRGVRPCVVVSNDSAIKAEGGFYVVPLYRKPSKTASIKDVLIRPVDCRGLRYEEYAGVLNMVLTVKCRVVRKIGHIKNDAIVNEITNSFKKLVDAAG